MIDRQGKQPLESFRPSALGQNSHRGNVGRGSVGTNRNVNERAFQDKRIETKVAPEQRIDLQLRNQAVGVRERDVTRSLFSMDGNVANFHLQMERNNVETADLRTAAGHSF